MKKFKSKAKVLLLTMAIELLSTFNLSAQEQNGRPGGLFGGNAQNSSHGLMDRSECTVGGYFTGQGFGATGAEITGQTFGAPLGDGLFFLIAAGAYYATCKSKKNKTERKK